jgi:hypothetical protein
MRVFLSWLRGECGYGSMVAVSAIEEGDAKRPSRERENLVDEQTRVINRLKAALAQLGIRGFNPKLRKAPQRLESLQVMDGLASTIPRLAPATTAANPSCARPQPIARSPAASALCGEPISTPPSDRSSAPPPPAAVSIPNRPSECERWLNRGRLHRQAANMQARTGLLPFPAGDMSDRVCSLRFRKSRGRAA